MTPREKQQNFYEAIGRAITQWQNVEIELFSIYSALIASPNKAAVSASFFAVTSFRAKLNMTNAAAQYTLKGKRLSDWKKLRNKASNKNDIRNELAHFMAFHDATGKDVRHMLRPNIFDAHAITRYKRKKYKSGVPEFGTDNLVSKAQSFGRLSQQLREFASRLWKRPPKFAS